MFLVEALNTLIREKHEQSESCTTIETSKTTKNVELHVENEESGLAFSSTGFSHVFGSVFRNENGVMLKRKNLTNPKNLLI